MKVRHGYALLNRGRIAAAVEANDRFVRLVFAVYVTKKEAEAARRESPHCTVQRVRIEVAK